MNDKIKGFYPECGLKVNRLDENKVADLKATIEKCTIYLAAKINSGEVIL